MTRQAAVSPSRTARPAAVLAPVLTLLSLGCGGATFENGVLHGEYTTYRVGALGGDWQRVSVDDNDLAFYSRGKGTIGANSTCRDYDDVPHVALMNHLLFGMQHRVYRVDEEVVLDGRGVRHAVVDAELDGVPVTLEVFLLTRDGCVYDLSLVSARAAHDRVRGEFHRFVSGFSVMPHD